MEAIDEALQEIKETGITAEQLEISKLNWEKQFYQGIQSISRKADILNTYNVHYGNPDLIQTDLERYLSVTPESIQETITTHLDPNKRVVLHINPAPKVEETTNQEEKAQ